MTPTGVDERVVVERTAWVRQMIAGIRALALESADVFLADERNPAAAESYLRRALESLLDLGRHVLSRAFGAAVVEYEQIARALQSNGVLSPEDAALLRELAGYRNRMVHFYDAVSEAELFEICSERLSDLERLLDAILRWIDEHPEDVRTH